MGPGPDDSYGLNAVFQRRLIKGMQDIARFAIFSRHSAGVVGGGMQVKYLFLLSRGSSHLFRSGGVVVSIVPFF